MLRFALGVVTGFAVSLAAMQLLLVAEPALPAVWQQAMATLWHTANRNLQGSVFLFLLVLLFYLRQLAALRSLLARAEPPLDRVLRSEQLLDLCASLFFGIGVIWTAIGMRGALLYALGDTAGVAAGSGMAVLQRLVEGGILLALSTTIVGGIGGYLMRAGKYLLCGSELSALYLRESQQPVQDNLATLQRIERRLDGAAAAENPVPQQ